MSTSTESAEQQQQQHHQSEMHSQSHSRSYVTRHNPQSRRCVHISAVQGGQVPSVVDDGMPVDLRICYPRASAASLQAAAANPSSLQALVRPRHLSQYQMATRDTTGSESWRQELAKLTRETFQHRQDTFAISQQAETSKQPTKRRESVHGADGQPHFENLELLQASVMEMLCRILQTADVGAVRSWLEAATPRERALVSDIIRSSIANKDEYFAGSIQGMTLHHHSPKAASTRQSQSLRGSTVSSSSGAANSGQHRPNRRSDSLQQQPQQQQQQQSASPASSFADETQVPERQLKIAVPPAGKKTCWQTSPTVNYAGSRGTLAGSRKPQRQPVGSPKRH